mmetsp:Transcript_14428/g.18695  ORF Transcript_14428/g.18695 Transcript_14428/m.18695 type:complete len:211 (+) Transcript_14428:203-835(+)
MATSRNNTLKLSQPLSMCILLGLDVLFHQNSLIFGRFLVFMNGVATAGPSFRGLRKRRMRWDQYGISKSADVEANDIIANLLLRNSWNRTVAGVTCMIVSLGRLEDHAIAVILLGLQKLGSLGVISTYFSLGTEKLSEKSKELLSYDIKTSIICIVYGIILLDRKRRRRDTNALQHLANFELRFGLDDIIMGLNTNTNTNTVTNDEQQQT